MDSLIGKIIGPYRILRKIGRGGMSIVFLAEDERLGRKVAMKMIDQPHLEREKVLSEARHLSQLNHPGIITIYDVIEHQDGIFIIMEYVEGDSLENFLRTHRVDIQLAFHLAKHIVDTVKIAHEHNLIHGDLKPGNIIITPEGNIKLLDFGLSQLLDVPPPNKNVAGTFPFISPEQLTGSPPNEQSDIFALGMIIYQLSTGVVPFRKENQAAQIYAIMNEEPAPPTRINKSVPTALNNIVIRCLEKDPTKRYKSLRLRIKDSIGSYSF
ncbi:MAG: serine/threonine-protein kinase [Calditrichota bacterium]